jgi:hypothetical protein
VATAAREILFHQLVFFFGAVHIFIWFRSIVSMELEPFELGPFIGNGNFWFVYFKNGGGFPSTHLLFHPFCSHYVFDGEFWLGGFDGLWNETTLAFCVGNPDLC